MVDYLPISYSGKELSNLFLGLFFGAVFILFLLKSLLGKRYSLNTGSPNIYIFEYESKAGRLFSLYNISNLLFKLITYLLFSLAILSFHQIIGRISYSIINVYVKIFLFLVIYFFIKLFVDYLYMRIIKKSNFISKIRFIRLSYENYLAFYLFILAFLVFFFPVKNHIFFIVTISISILWFIFAFSNFYNSLTKHLDLKKYQIILYLCLSEILPFISLIGWIIFQIL